MAWCKIDVTSLLRHWSYVSFALSHQNDVQGLIVDPEESILPSRTNRILSQSIPWALQWRHNGCDSVSNHQRLDCLLKRLSGRRSKKHQSSASLAFVRGFHRWPVNSPHKGPVTRKMVPFNDVTMALHNCSAEFTVRKKTFEGTIRISVSSIKIVM